MRPKQPSNELNFDYSLSYPSFCYKSLKLYVCLQKLSCWMDIADQDEDKTTCWYEGKKNASHLVTEK